MPEDILWLFKVVEVGKVDPDHIFPGLSTLIGLFCFFESSLALLGLTILDQNGFGLDLLHDGSSLLEHLELQVESSCLLVILRLLVDLSSLQVLLHILADNSNISQ